MTINGLAPGSHVVGFSAIPGWMTPVNQTVILANNQTTFATGNYVQESAVQVALTPDNVTGPAGAEWRLDFGPIQTNGATVSNVTAGLHTIYGIGIDGYVSPVVSLMVTGGESTNINALYVPETTPSDGLVLLTNGPGTISHAFWPAVLVPGNIYTVTADPASGYVLQNWFGGTGTNFDVLYTNAAYTFIMESNLVLEANFVTNVVLAMHGGLDGLFGPSDSPRALTNSGLFTFTMTADGAVTGKVLMNGKTWKLAGKFGDDGHANLIATAPKLVTLSLNLQLNLAGNSVNGTVTDGNFISQATGYTEAPGTARNPSPCGGKHTFAISGGTNVEEGPGGSGVGVINVSPAGRASFIANLADGTSASESGMTLAGGNWPLYINFPSGRGSLWGWLNFNGSGITNTTPISWINTGNAHARAYPAGFTNQNATLSGSTYTNTFQPLLNYYFAFATMSGAGLDESLATPVVLSPKGQLTLPRGVANTNHLSLSINKSTGLVTGKFAEPSHPGRAMRINAVLLQKQGIAAGYFIDAQESGSFIMAAP
jgi:hypothetical protein